VLLGRTADGGRVWDVIAAARAVAASPRVGGSGAGPAKPKPPTQVTVAGGRAAGVIAAYAAALDETLAGAALVSPPASHMDAGAPQFLNVLRVADVPDVVGLIAPRPVLIDGGAGSEAFGRTKSAYAAARVAERVRVK
jgi:hypothetical protein